tara:strand:- start:384 stop:518 length:135 start_codon:yes stop_codon:yes gene_type:complete
VISETVKEDELSLDEDELSLDEEPSSFLAQDSIRLSVNANKAAM